MGQPAAKQGDRVLAMDTHIVTGKPDPVQLPFTGVLMQNLSPTVKIMGKPAATVGSVAINTPPHVGAPSATNQGNIIKGSATVKINGKPAARAGDTAMTCNDPSPLPIGKVVAVGTVNIG